MKNSRFYLSVFTGLIALFLFTGPGLCAEVIVDDGDAGFTSSYGWVSYTGIPTTSYNRDCLRKPGWTPKDVTSCSYRPTLPDAGEYEVYVWWPNPYSDTLNVPYIIHYSGGVETVYVNQGKNYGSKTWKLIGKWQFDKGSTGYVEVQNKTTSTSSQYVYADAMKFVYVGIPNNPPMANASSDKITGDAPLIVNFYGTGTDSDGTIAGYKWNFGDNSAEVTQQNPTHTYQNPGTYTATLTVTDDKGAAGTDSLNITVNLPPLNKPPVAIPSASPTTGEAPLEVHFTGSGTDSDGTVISYSWDFGDGNTSTQQNPVHTYQNAGVYLASLRVTDNEGATGTVTIAISVMTQQIPHLIRFQGRLTDKNKIPLSGSYDITFRIYDAEQGGNLEWGETHADTNITAGMVNVLLGSINPIDLKFDKHYWLSTKVGSDAEMTPRQMITSVGYTYRAEFAAKGGTGAYTAQGEISDTLSSKLSMHLEGAPSSVKLYIWGEAASGGGYPDGLIVEIDGIDKTSALLALADNNWGASETQFGNGTASHPLVSGANGITGTGGLDITALASWSLGEHTIVFKHSATIKAKVRYNVYVSY